VLEEASPNILSPRTDWREQQLVLRPNYVVDRAQAAGISRDDVGETLNFATDGLTAGTYREG
jgi:multidrug efflux pump subunit AcrB